MMSRSRSSDILSPRRNRIFAQKRLINSFELGVSKFEVQYSIEGNICIVVNKNRDALILRLNRYYL